MPFLDIYLTSVVIDDFHVYRTLLGPTKTHSKLIVDSDTVLTLAIPSQRFEAISRRGSQEVEGMCRIEHDQLPCRDVGNT